MSADKLINAFLAGRQLLDQRRRQQQEDEDRALEREGVQLRLRAMKLDEKLRKREIGLQNFNLLEGRPESELTEGGVLPARAAVSPSVAPAAAQDDADLWSQPGGVDPYAQPNVAPAGALASAVGDRSLVTPRRSVTIPGIEEMGVDAVSMQPQSMEEIMAARAAEDRRRFLQTPREVGGRLVTPEGPGGKPVVHYEPPVKPDEPEKVTYDLETRMVDGKERDVLLGSDGNFYFPGDTKKPVSADRVRPVPKKETETGGITPAQKAAAERWRSQQLNTLDNRYRLAKTGGYDGMGRLIPPMSEADYKAAKDRIESAYRESIGQAQPAAVTSPTSRPPSSKMQHILADAAALRRGGTKAEPTPAASATKGTQYQARRHRRLSGEEAQGLAVRPDGQVELEPNADCRRHDQYGSHDDVEGRPRRSPVEGKRMKITKVYQDDHSMVTRSAEGDRAERAYRCAASGGRAR